MAQTNGSILRSYFEEVVNQKRLDLISKYFSEKFIGHGSPYVGMGVMIDDSSGDKVTIRHVHPGSPAQGKLQEGDELLRVVDGEKTWKGFEELRHSLWGQGALGSLITLHVRRDKAEREVPVTRGLVQGFEYPYSMLEDGNREFFKEYPDLKIRLVNVIEAGDLVAYHAENQGHNTRFGRSAVWAEFGYARFQDGKITDWWSSDDSASLLKQLGYTILPPA